MVELTPEQKAFQEREARRKEREKARMKDIREELAGVGISELSSEIKNKQEVIRHTTVNESSMAQFLHDLAIVSWWVKKKDRESALKEIRPAIFKASQKRLTRTVDQLGFLQREVGQGKFNAASERLDRERDTLVKDIEVSRNERSNAMSQTRDLEKIRSERIAYLLELPPVRKEVPPTHRGIVLKESPHGFREKRSE